MKIYLAGGMKSGWQKKVKRACRAFDVIFFDPCSHGLSDPAQYTLWDLDRIHQCDILFGFMETTNPSGHGLSAEIGYAHGLGKKIILVDEKSDRYMAIVREIADVVLSSLQDGIVFLKSVTRKELC